MGLAREDFTMNLFTRILFGVLVAIAAVCATAAYQVYSGGQYSNIVALVMGAAAFSVTWVVTSNNRYQVPWWW